jgi:hypothetical protein
VPPCTACAAQGPSSPEVTRAFCLVPSTSFSQAPWYALPVHLCRFRVRSLTLELFPGTPSWQEQSSKPSPLAASVTSSRPRNINLVPIDYAFRPRLRGRLTLRGLTLRRNPWTFGDSVSHTVCRYSCQHSHFRYLQATSRLPFAGLRNAPLPLLLAKESAASVRGFSPVTFSAQAGLFRPVSYYAFFKGWLLLSQPPGCFGLPTSFPT